MRWKDLPNWLRGGLIGIIFLILIDFIFVLIGIYCMDLIRFPLICYNAFISDIFNFPLYLTNQELFSAFGILIDIVVYFLIGALISLLYSKIKK